MVEAAEDVEGFEHASALADRCFTSHDGEVTLLFLNKESYTKAFAALGFDVSLSQTTAAQTSNDGGLFKFRMKRGDDSLALVSELEEVASAEKKVSLKDKFDEAKRNIRKRNQTKIGFLEQEVSEGDVTTTTRYLACRTARKHDACDQSKSNLERKYWLEVHDLTVLVNFLNGLENYSVAGLRCVGYGEVWFCDGVNAMRAAHVVDVKDYALWRARGQATPDDVLGKSTLLFEAFNLLREEAHQIRNVQLARGARQETEDKIRVGLRAARSLLGKAQQKFEETTGKRFADYTRQKENCEPPKFKFLTKTGSRHRSVRTDSGCLVKCKVLEFSNCKEAMAISFQPQQQHTCDIHDCRWKQHPGTRLRSEIHSHMRAGLSNSQIKMILDKKYYSGKFQSSGGAIDAASFFHSFLSISLFFFFFLILL